MLSSSKRKGQCVQVAHTVEVKTDLSAFSPATRTVLTSELVKFILVNRGLSSTSVHELQRVLQLHNQQRQHDEEERKSAGLPARRAKRPPASVKRAQKFLASVGQLVCNLESQLASCVGADQLCLVLGPTASRPREVYYVEFQQPGGQWDAPTVKQLGQASRSLVRTLLQGYNTIQAWEKPLPSGTKLHLLLKQLAGEAGPPSATFLPKPHLAKVLDPLGLSTRSRGPALQLRVVICAKSSAGTSPVDPLAQATAALSLQEPPQQGCTVNEADSSPAHKLAVVGVRSGHAIHAACEADSALFSQGLKSHTLCMGIVTAADHSAAAAGDGVDAVCAARDEDGQRVGACSPGLWWQCTVCIKGLPAPVDDGAQMQGTV